MANFMDISDSSNNWASSNNANLPLARSTTFTSYPILQCVSEWLTIKELGMFRLVSKDCYRGTLSQYRKDAPVISLSEADACLGWGKLPELNSMSAEKTEFLQYRSGLSRFKLNDFKFDKEWISKHRFWETSKHTITFLHLDMCVFRSVASFREFISSKTFPNLEKLILQQTTFHCKKVAEMIPTRIERHKNMKSLEIIARSDHEFPVSWVELLHYFEKLQKLTLRNSSGGKGYDVGRVLDATMCLQLRNTTIPLTSLDVCGERSQQFPADIIQFFTENDNSALNITEFSCGVEATTTAAQLLSLITWIGDDLKKLLLKGDPTRVTNATNPLDLPDLNELEDLELLWMDVQGLDFLAESCPKLKSLSIQEHKHDEFRASYNDLNLIEDERRRWRVGEANASEPASSSLQSYLCNVVFHMDRDDILSLKQWAPQISKLLMHLDNVTFKSVCEELSGLKHLFIYQSLVNDDGMTGVMGCKHFIPVISDDNSRLEFVVAYDHRVSSSGSVAYFDLEVLKTCAGLANLKNLKVLAIHHSVRTYMDHEKFLSHEKLTARSALWAILKLASLAKLYVSPDMMTDDGIRLLAKSFDGFHGGDMIDQQQFLKLK